MAINKIGAPPTPEWFSPTNWFGEDPFPSGPPTVPEGKLSYEDWWKQIGSGMAYSVSFGSPAASYLDYIGKTETTDEPTTPPRPTPTEPTKTDQEPTTTQAPIDFSVPTKQTRTSTPKDFDIRNLSQPLYFPGQGYSGLVGANVYDFFSPIDWASKAMPTLPSLADLYGFNYYSSLM